MLTHAESARDRAAEANRCIKVVSCPSTGSYPQAKSLRKLERAIGIEPTTFSLGSGFKLFRSWRFHQIYTTRVVVFAKEFDTRGDPWRS
ncbi:hypothetical protein [Methylobacterium fujisawaense]|uniref:hypothetical protein n=1 Tax=Methylobacterium fujisawaense TaxID=107400 RepID=UPI002F357955